METEFWGAEVKNGEPLKVSPGSGRVLHLSQASLGEHENGEGKENVSLFVNLDGKKLVLGTLITNKLPQHQFDLLFDRDFELSHNWKSGSVYFYGYKASNSSGEDESTEGESDEFESEDDIPLNLANNGRPESSVKQEKPESKVKQEKSEFNTKQEKPESKPEQEKPESKPEQEKPESKTEQEKPESKAEQEKPAEAERSSAPNEESDAGNDSVKIVETHKNLNPQEDDESSYEDLMSEEGDEDNSQVETSKKRPVESATKTPVPKKKAKVAPQETDGNKTAPLPGNEANKQTPKSGKSYPCKMCNKSFGTEQGVEAHTKAKHGDGK